MSVIDFGLGFLFSFLIGFAAYKKHALSISGFYAALFVGTLIYGFAGFISFLLLMVFFLSAAVISKFDPEKKPSNRNAKRVIANAVTATALAIIYGLFDNQIWLILYVVSLGISTADTWSSEIGKRSLKPPVHILTFKPMKKGLSGAVSPLGLIAGLGASILFGIIGLLMFNSAVYGVLIAVFSFIGCIIDSLLGVIQVKYKHLDSLEIIEEKTVNTMQFSGIYWLDNNAVNLFSNVLTVLLMMPIFIN